MMRKNEDGDDNDDKEEDGDEQEDGLGGGRWQQ